jgi:hypothetical protein
MERIVTIALGWIRNRDWGFHRTGRMQETTGLLKKMRPQGGRSQISRRR